MNKFSLYFLSAGLVAVLFFLGSCAAQDDSMGDYNFPCLNMSTTEHDTNCSDEKYWTSAGNSVVLTGIQNSPYEKVEIRWTGGVNVGNKNVTSPNGLVYITGTDTFYLDQSAKLTINYSNIDRINGQIVTKVRKGAEVRDIEVSFTQVNKQ